MSPLRGSHQPISSTSQPSSPIEEDLAQASAWDDTSTLVSPNSKGKGKQRAGDDDDDDDNTTVNSDSIQQVAGEYPPMAGEDIEARKVEENLKRWETLEKQRRKNARDSRFNSAHSSSSSAFSVVDVSRRASALWNGRHDRSRPRIDPMHSHQVLEDIEESVSLHESGPPSATSPPDTPRSSLTKSTSKASTENPFENPQYVAVWQDSTTGVSKSSSKAEMPILRVEDPLPHKNRPRPSGLPPPIHPPPPPGTVPQRQASEEDAERTRKRWWTEWLCGCREDEADQAGHTNPME